MHAKSLLQHEMRGDVFPLEKETHGFVIQTRGMQSAVHRMQAQMMLWGTFSTRTPSDHCPFLPAACQLGFYKSDPGDQLCAKCPPHSHSESRAARVCRCDSSFYRAVQDPPSAACTRKYPPTWLCVCCPGTAAFQPQLSLSCRVRGMGFHRARQALLCHGWMVALELGMQVQPSSLHWELSAIEMGQIHHRRICLLELQKCLHKALGHGVWVLGGPV